MRRRLRETFLASEKEVLAAFRRRWTSTRYCQDMAELLAKLEGELGRDASEGGTGVQVIILRNDGPLPLDPETFRAALAKRLPETRAPEPEGGTRF